MSGQEEWRELLYRLDERLRAVEEWQQRHEQEALAGNSERERADGDPAGTRGLACVPRRVARGPAAPERGYIRSDIPLLEWNRYQMAKAVGQ